MLILSKLAFWQMRLSKNLQNTFKHYILCQLTFIFHLHCSDYFIARKVIKISRESGPNRTSYLGYLKKQNCTPFTRITRKLGTFGFPSVLVIKFYGIFTYHVNLKTFKKACRPFKLNFWPWFLLASQLFEPFCGCYAT